MGLPSPTSAPRSVHDSSTRRHRRGSRFLPHELSPSGVRQRTDDCGLRRAVADSRAWTLDSKAASQESIVRIRSRFDNSKLDLRSRRTGGSIRGWPSSFRPAERNQRQIGQTLPHVGSVTHRQKHCHQSADAPTERHQPKEHTNSVPPRGLEPRTNGLKVRCSTVELEGPARRKLTRLRARLGPLGPVSAN
jgi:hypothetical protein